eukprot:scaffold10537_cov122-Isochrysis_galbana.AAC.15
MAHGPSRMHTSSGFLESCGVSRIDHPNNPLLTSSDISSPILPQLLATTNVPELQFPVWFTLDGARPESDRGLGWLAGRR